MFSAVAGHSLPEPLNSCIYEHGVLAGPLTSSTDEIGARRCEILYEQRPFHCLGLSGFTPGRSELCRPLAPASDDVLHYACV